MTHCACAGEQSRHATGFNHFPLITLSVGALSVVDTLILTLEGDGVRRKGNLVFAVSKTKIGGSLSSTML